MTYECFSRFVSSSRVLYNVGHLIQQSEYDKLTSHEREKFREWNGKPFNQQIAENIQEEDKLDNEDN